MDRGLDSRKQSVPQVHIYKVNSPLLHVTASGHPRDRMPHQRLYSPFSGLSFSIK
jgi:hypothetical protein